MGWQEYPENDDNFQPLTEEELKEFKARTEQVRECFLLVYCKWKAAGVVFLETLWVFWATKIFSQGHIDRSFCGSPFLVLTT